MKGVVNDARRSQSQVVELERAKETLQAKVASLSSRAEKAEAHGTQQQSEAKRFSTELERNRQHMQNEKRKLMEEFQAQQQRSREQGLREKHLESKLQEVCIERDGLVATNSTVTSETQRALAASDEKESHLQQLLEQSHQANEQQRQRLEALELELATQ